MEPAVEVLCRTGRHPARTNPGCGGVKGRSVGGRNGDDYTSGAREEERRWRLGLLGLESFVARLSSSDQSPNGLRLGPL